MLKIKRNKKLMIPIIAMILVVAMAGSALAAQSSSYSMSIPEGDTLLEYGTHVYGDGSDSSFSDNNTSTTTKYESRLYNVTAGHEASLGRWISSGTNASAMLYPEYQNTTDKYRYQGYDYYNNGPISTSGRYGIK